MFDAAIDSLSNSMSSSPVLRTTKSFRTAKYEVPVWQPPMWAREQRAAALKRLSRIPELIFELYPNHEIDRKKANEKRVAIHRSRSRAELFDTPLSPEAAEILEGL